MTRIYSKKDLTKGKYIISSEVYDKSTLVAVFFSFVDSVDGVMNCTACLHARGYNLFSEQRLFAMRVSAIVSGALDCDTANVISSALFD